jgi:hypothetical protein
VFKELKIAQLRGNRGNQRVVVNGKGFHILQETKGDRDCTVKGVRVKIANLQLGCSTAVKHIMMREVLA